MLQRAGAQEGNVLEQRDRVDRDEVEALVEQPGPGDPRGIRDDGTVGATTVVPATPVESEPRVTTRRRFTWGQGLILLAGVTCLVFGIGAIALAGLAGSITEPVVDVFGFDHTPLLGVIEVGAGVVLVLAALVPGGRWVAGLVGGAAIAGGALILAEYDWTQTELAAEQDFGWVAIAVGAAAYIGAMVAPRRRVVEAA
jgi:MFS family permease